MNESYERSYYEIALTNSQVLSALAVLLLCLLGSFVAGMWVAREAGAAPAEAVAVATENEASESDQGEFQFFNKPGGGAGTAQQTQPVQADATPPRTVTPVEVESEASREAQRRPQLQDVKPLEQPVRQADRDADAPQPTERAAPTQQAAASDRATEAVQTESAARPTPAPLTQMLVIQVLSSSDQEQAGKVAAQLKGSGYRAYLSSAEVEGRTMYRVRVGPYSDHAQAEDAAQKIKRQFRLNTWITAQS